MIQSPPSPASSKTGGKYYLVLDVGTTGIKALLFDNSLALVSRSYAELQKNFPKRGWVEQDPSQLVAVSIKVLQEAVEQSGLSGEVITSLGITNQRETVIAWDSHTGKALYPAIVWEDTRTSLACTLLRLRGKQEFVRSRTGLPIDPYFSATKMSWLLKNVAAVKKALADGTLRMGTVDSWLLWNLTTTKEFKTDYTNASRTLLFNTKNLSWDSELFKLFGVPHTILPPVVPSTSNFGVVKPEILRGTIPITAICGDQQASMYAAGVEPLTTKITYGTGAFLMQIIGQKFQLYPNFFTTVVPMQSGGTTYALEAKVGECGSRITPTLNNPEKLKAVITEIATEVAAYTKKLPHTPTELIADGGGIKSSFTATIQSSTSGIPVREQSIFDGTALGVAKLLASS